MKKLILATAISSVLLGCGGGDSDPVVNTPNVYERLSEKYGVDYDTVYNACTFEEYKCKLVSDTGTLTTPTYSANLENGEFTSRQEFSYKDAVSVSVVEGSAKFVDVDRKSTIIQNNKSITASISNGVVSVESISQFDKASIETWGTMISPAFYSELELTLSDGTNEIVSVVNHTYAIGHSEPDESLALFNEILASGEVVWGDDVVEPDPNVAPVVNPISHVETTERNETTVQVNATDANNDKLTYSLANRVSFASIDPETGLITLSPMNYQSGEYNLTVNVTDGKLISSAAFQITVNKGSFGAAPVIQQVDDFTITGNSGYNMTISDAEDSLFDLKVSLVSDDDWIKIVKSQNQWWRMDIKPQNKDVGQHVVKILAEDSDGNRTSMSFRITVNKYVQDNNNGETVSDFDIRPELLAKNVPDYPNLNDQYELDKITAPLDSFNNASSKGNDAGSTKKDFLVETFYNIRHRDTSNSFAEFKDATVFADAPTFPTTGTHNTDSHYVGAYKKSFLENRLDYYNFLRATYGAANAYISSYKQASAQTGAWVGASTGTDYLNTTLGITHEGIVNSANTARTNGVLKTTTSPSGNQSGNGHLNSNKETVLSMFANAPKFFLPTSKDVGLSSYNSSFVWLMNDVNPDQDFGVDSVSERTYYDSYPELNSPEGVLMYPSHGYFPVQTQDTNQSVTVKLNGYASEVLAGQFTTVDLQLFKHEKDGDLTSLGKPMASTQDYYEHRSGVYKIKMRDSWWNIIKGDITNNYYTVRYTFHSNKVLKPFYMNPTVGERVVLQTTYFDMNKELVEHEKNLSELDSFEVVVGSETEIDLGLGEYTLHDAPDWITISEDGSLIVDASKVKSGLTTITVAVVDQNGNISYVDVVINVANKPSLDIDDGQSNHAPVTADQSITVNSEEINTLQIDATDIDRDKLTYSIDTNLDWVSIDKNGLITIDSDGLNDSTSLVTVKVSDGQITVKSTVEITVNKIGLALSGVTSETDVRVIELSWDNDPSATSYMITRNGTDLTEVSGLTYSDSTSHVNREFTYTVRSCVDDVCDGIPSNSLTIKTGSIVLYLETSGLDTSVPNSFNPNYVVHGAWDNANHTNANGRKRARLSNYFDGNTGNNLYRWHLITQPSNGQICPIDASVKYAHGAPEVSLAISCTTPAYVETQTKSITIQAGSANGVGSPLVLKRVSDDVVINSNAYLYESSNESIATVNEQGFLTGVNGGEVTITVTPNPEYYGKGGSDTYQVIVENLGHYTMNKFDYGQQLMLPSTNSHQVLTPNLGFLVRAYPVAKSAENVTMPSLEFVVELGNEQAVYPVTCPSELPLTQIEGNDYGLDNSCYAKVEGEKVNLVTQESRFFYRDANTGAEFTINPKVNTRYSLPVTIVPVTANGDPAKLPNVELVKQRLLQTMPFANVDLRVREPYIYNGDESKIGTFLGIADSLRKAESRIEGEHYIAYVNTPDQCSVMGVAYVGGLHASGIRDIDCLGEGYSVHRATPHELGHNFSLNHAPAGYNAVGWDAFWKQEPQPWEGAKNGWMSFAPIIKTDTTGVATIASRDEDGTVNTDVMGYQQGQYFSEYSHKKMANYINVRNTYLNPLQEGKSLVVREEATVISGSIDSKGLVTFKPVSTYVAMIDEPAMNSDFELRIATSSGDQVYPLTVVTTGNDETTLHFSVAIPKVNGIQDLNISYKSNELVKKELSRGKSSKNGFTSSVDVYGHDAVITWNASAYPWLTVYGTTFDGENKLLSHNALSGEIELDVENIEQIVVTLSDGLNITTETIKL
ncbi:cadherin repeat domain-containing protein [Vibrio renipiscarius]|uniref:Cadherin domain-containing protein n=1 Tax=Vibrio renipiscarius TaxID=1461322 RepID=A0A0C2K0F6_9VIBR|nr:cadherin repeat domain-containing protein [Vibrio renipiscarius]KII75403.1 hypothetical protein OJ16_19165 [Vibrio renipiscarius]KII78856.1 hypothetical protein PL18_11275 [Vibrio renipiscarius]